MRLIGHSLKHGRVSARVQGQVESSGPAIFRVNPKARDRLRIRPINPIVILAYDDIVTS